MIPVNEYLSRLPSNIESINLAHSNLTELPDLYRFYNLRYLFCNNNKLTTLPPFNKTLKYVNCSDNRLTSLPPFNYNLETLYCHHNELTNLPTFNHNLITIYCNQNKLTSLPPFNRFLKTLCCDFNMLTCLPVINQNMQNLYCIGNRLTYLPPLNTKMLTLRCSFNCLTNLPILPPSLSEFACDCNDYDSILYLLSYNDLEGNKRIIQKLFNCKHLYYSLKFKKRFRDWLWIKVREPKIREQYSTANLLKLLEKDDLEHVLDTW